MRILITGGTGVISSGLVYECVSRGYEVFTLTRGNNKFRNVNEAKNIYCDIWDTDSVRTKVGNMKFDVVVDCLTYTVEQLKISLCNFSGICNQYVFISTAGVYNRQGDKKIKESDEKNFIEWTYSKNKIECENYLINYCLSQNIIYTIIRPTVTYGDYRIPFPVATRTPGWTFFQRMLDGKPMLASDNVKFSIIHIEDFSRAVVSLFGNQKAFNEDFHITSDLNEIYWDDVIEAVGKILNIKPKVIHVPAEVFGKIYLSLYDEIKYHKNTVQLFDNTKLNKAVNFTSKIRLEEGIARMIRSMKNEFDTSGLQIDKRWNHYCNATIYYSYIHKILSKEEKNILDLYFDKSETLSFIKSYVMVYVYKVKRSLRIIRKKLK